MVESPLIDVHNISRHYASNTAVDGISFQLHAGEVLGFLGPNGAGKSTTMQIISGNLTCHQGSVLIKGLDLKEHPAQCKRHIGYCPETPPLYKDLTVDEYLTYCAQLHQINTSQRAPAIDRCKQLCGLSTVGKRIIGLLSKGYQQRVGIAQAIIHKPEIVILDEPTVGLDPIQIVEIRSLIKQLGEECGVILSTHILPEVQATCDRVQIIKQGKLIYHSELSQLDQKTQTASLVLAAEHLPDIEHIALDPGKQQVTALDEHRVLIHYEGENPAQELIKKSVEQGWGLFEITPQKTSLEEVFVSLTTTEGAANS